MSVIYNAATKTARMTAVRDQIDAGSGAGKLKIGTTGMAATLVTLALNDPSGSVAGSTLTLSGFPKTQAASGSAGGQTAAAATLTDSDDTVVVSGLTVGTTGTDVILDAVVIANSQNVTINSAALTHA
jgi:hypothetical protein